MQWISQSTLQERKTPTLFYTIDKSVQVKKYFAAVKDSKINQAIDSHGGSLF